MDFFKKIGKEVSVFGLVFVVFIALFAYRQVTHVELSTISQDKLEEKIKDKDSFVVVVGSDKDNTTLNYKNVCLKYLEKNHSDKIYYANLAKEKGITRSMAAVEIAARDKGRKLFVFGNAPTALYKAMEMRDSKELNLDAIVGVPVGFVGAAESKDELEKTDIPYIISKGRKGGSNLAAAIINAILYAM